jgi:hypothetical protein
MRPVPKFALLAPLMACCALGSAGFVVTTAAAQPAPGNPQSIPPYPESKLITGVIWDKYRLHKGDGDMWPITWAVDDNLYGSAGDNHHSPMNYWKVVGKPYYFSLYLLDNLPIDPAVYCQRPHVDPKRGVKPAGLISVGGVLYYAVETINYGDDPKFNRQHNISGWIITSTDLGRTWDRSATAQDFFSGRFASIHFLQFGKDYGGSRDDYVYAYFPAADDGNSYWENGDQILLGRVPKDKITVHQAWEFFAGADDSKEAHWSSNGELAQPVFRYFHMTGENHVSYDKGIKRYLMGNYSFMDEAGNPRPYHQIKANQGFNVSACPSQLTLYEAPEPWGPWSLFYRNDDWGKCGDYQPSFPTKWMSETGTELWMVSAGSYEDYNFTVQKLTLVLTK